MRFNLSHSAGLALIAVCRDHEVGVDVERIRPRRNLLRLAERVLGPAAAAAVREASPETRLAVFHEAWTRHEVIVKYHGGRGTAPSAVNTSVYRLDIGNRYANALALAEPPRTITYD
jgi:phosphopantetheinyl transferase